MVSKYVAPSGAVAFAAISRCTAASVSRGCAVVQSGCPIECFDRRSHGLDKFRQGLVRAGPAVNRDPLFHAFQMGRTVKPDSVPGRGQHGGNHGSRGAFTLGARHVNDVQRQLRIAQPGHEISHPVEFEVALIRNVERPLVINAADQKGFGRVALDHRRGHCWGTGPSY